jgi:NADH-quinone oxidoreductase subunit J
MEDISFRQTLFYCFAFVLTGSALGVVFHRNPVKSALFLVSFFHRRLPQPMRSSALKFWRRCRCLVYVGAIMVLFLFVIMLISVREERVLKAL